ncbi:MAG TPA: hypothetical protein VGF89_11900 [Steroidobacteraceae bacterium]
MSAQSRVAMNPDQRRRVRRSAWVLGVIVMAFYVGFILYSILHGHR